MEVARGADGMGVAAAEHLPLIAGLDKETCQRGNQSCSAGGECCFFLWPRD